MISRLIALIALLVLALPTMAVADVTPADQAFYLRNTGTGCGADANFSLRTKAGGAESNCGYVGGFSFGEALDSTKTFAAADGMPAVLDASRDVAGTVRILHGNGLVGVGRVDVNITLSATTPANPFGATQIGAVKLSQIVTSTVGQDFPFTMDIADSLNAKDISGLTLTVEVRGAHANTGYVSASNGQSRLTLPILVDNGA